MWRSVHELPTSAAQSRVEEDWILATLTSARGPEPHPSFIELSRAELPSVEAAAGAWRERGRMPAAASLTRLTRARDRW